MTFIFKLNGLKPVDNVIFNAHNTEPYQKQLDGRDMFFCSFAVTNIFFAPSTRFLLGPFQKSMSPILT